MTWIAKLPLLFLIVVFTLIASDRVCKIKNPLIESLNKASPEPRICIAYTLAEDIEFSRRIYLDPMTESIRDFLVDNSEYPEDLVENRGGLPFSGKVLYETFEEEFRKRMSSYREKWSGNRKKCHCKSS
ncbi:uncharacterized protein LOC136039949 [Artemia franciscana]|uniref:uncharacterized protein LOC136039949 n=1 Tax=Artemia franciscana TaxID=6661 RepID=UPI0032D9C85A